MPDNSSIRVKVGGVEVDVAGTEELVHGVFEELKGAIIARLESASALPEVAEPDRAGDGSAGGALPLKQFWEMTTKPTSAQKLVVLFAYYRKKHADGATINKPQATELFNQARVKVPAVDTAFHNAAKTANGWLRRTGKGVYEITGAGESMVETDLIRKT